MFRRLFGRRKRDDNIVDRWYVVVDDTAPDLDDPAMLIHVVDLDRGKVPSIARRNVRWETNENTVDYFRRTSTDPGLRVVSRAHAGEIADLWGAAWPPPHVDW